MPMCPNCGGWVSEGSSTCSCGTPVGDFSSVPDEVDKEEIKREVRDEIIGNMVTRRTKEAERLAEMGRYGEAIEKYEDALDVKYSSRIVREIGHLHFKMGEYEKALESYDSINDRSNVALALIELGRCDEAIDAFEKLIEEADSKFPTPDFNQDRADDEGYVDRYRERYQDSEERKFSYLARTYNDLGWAYNKMGDYDKAIKCYEKGIGYDQNFAGNWNCKAIALDSLGKYDEALKFYDIALTIDVADKIILKNREECLKSYGRAYLSGKYPVKSEYLEEALELAGEESDSVDLETETIKRPAVKTGPNFGQQAKILNEIGRENLITIAGTYYHGSHVFQKGMTLKLVREEDNPHDRDAIAVYRDNDKVGYVANSDSTCCGMTSRASDIRIDEMAFAEYLFYYIDTYHVAKIIW
ncbi:tetratricopeptide repeat protein [Methanobrevibacter sp.]|uniref:tetratricopeptide repeat protein n=1 Tax=Methanobrevibacter sp. TaxID=66852 RepID=UPI0038660EBD